MSSTCCVPFSMNQLLALALAHCPVLHSDRRLGKILLASRSSRPNGLLDLCHVHLPCVDDLFLLVVAFYLGIFHEFSTYFVSKKFLLANRTSRNELLLALQWSTRYGERATGTGPTTGTTLPGSPCCSRKIRKLLIYSMYSLEWFASSWIVLDGTAIVTEIIYHLISTIMDLYLVTAFSDRKLRYETSHLMFCSDYTCKCTGKLETVIIYIEHHANFSAISTHELLLVSVVVLGNIVCVTSSWLNDQLPSFWNQQPCYTHLLARTHRKIQIILWAGPASSDWSFIEKTSVKQSMKRKECSNFQVSFLHLSQTDPP